MLINFNISITVILYLVKYLIKIVPPFGQKIKELFRLVTTLNLTNKFFITIIFIFSPKEAKVL